MQKESMILKKKNSMKSENNDILKNYIKKINYLLYGKDTEKIKTNQAKFFEDQKGKGYVNLPIALSKIYAILLVLVQKN